MSGALAIRLARPSDVDGLTELVRGLAIYQGDDPAPITAGSVRSGMIEAGFVDVLVAEDSGLIGYCAASPTYESAYASAGLYISDLFVAENRRGQGAGKALLAAMAAHGRKRGFEHVWLTAIAENKAAQDWYAALTNVSAPVVAYALTHDAFDDLSRQGDNHLTREGRNDD